MTFILPRVFGLSVDYEYLSSFWGGCLQIVIDNGQEKKINKEDWIQGSFSIKKKGGYRNRITR